MATSGTFTGSRASGAGSTSPRLILDWSRVETDITKNRSKIRLTLKLQVSGRVNFSANKTGKIHGSSFTFTGGVNGSSTTRTLRQRDVWVNHNADGTKSQTFSATFNINITYSGVKINNLSVSGTANIDAIPRASGFTAFSLSNTTVNTSTANTVTYTLDRKSSAFSHRMTLKLGNKTIKSWDDSGTGSRTSGLTAAQVNEIIKGRPNNTSGTLTLTMQTKSGSTNIGSSVSRTRKFNISTDVKPSASGITATISGNGRDKAINRFVQNITKVASSFTSSAGYGASVSSRSIVIRRVSGAANSQTISGSSGTTANAVSLNGTYEAIGTIKDSRGRSATSRRTFEVQAYSVPVITKFTAVRDKTESNTVLVTRVGRWSSLGTGTASLNNLTISVQRRLSTSSTWESIENITGDTGSFSTSVNSTGNADSSSYEFRITITDTFGKKATALVKVPTSIVELTISKGKGIGVGKIHEKGAIDVGPGGINIEHLINPLWEGASYPNATTTINVPKNLKDCMNGWLLRWQRYIVGERRTENSNFEYTIVPKIHAYYNSGHGVRVLLGGIDDTTSVTYSKYLYIHNDKIVGHEDNASGDQRFRVLTGVFEY